MPRTRTRTRTPRRAISASIQPDVDRIGSDEEEEEEEEDNARRQRHLPDDDEYEDEDSVSDDDDSDGGDSSDYEVFFPWRMRSFHCLSLSLSLSLFPYRVMSSPFQCKRRKTIYRKRRRRRRQWRQGKKQLLRVIRIRGPPNTHHVYHYL